MLIIGVVGMLSRQKHAVHPAECSIEHKWPSIQQNAVDGSYSLEYTEASPSSRMQFRARVAVYSAGCS